MTASRSLKVLLLAAFAGLSMNLSAQTPQPGHPEKPPTGVENTGHRNGDPADKLLTPEQIQKKAEEDRKRAEEAQAEQAKQAAEAMKGCAACGTSMMMTIIIGSLAILVLHVILMVWVARDAKSRGMDGAVLWVFLMLFIGVIGLVVYLFSRPQGALTVCPSCGGKRLAVSAICPHCRNA